MMIRGHATLSLHSFPPFHFHLSLAPQVHELGVQVLVVDVHFLSCKKEKKAKAAVTPVLILLSLIAPAFFWPVYHLSFHDVWCSSSKALHAMRERVCFPFPSHIMTLMFS